MRLVAALAPLLVVASAGCDQLFKLQDIKSVVDAAEPDAAPACEDPAPFGTSCRPLTLPLTNDTFLSASAPDTAFGTRDAIRISNDEPGLFKFDTTQIAADERIAAMTLTLDPNWSKNAKTCSVSGIICEACPTPSIGGWTVHWTITGWNQANATWNLADAPATPWTTPGANAIPEDRSPPVAMGPPPTGQVPLVMDISGAQLLAHSPSCYQSADRLALLVTIDGLSYFDSSELNNCSTSTTRATLAVTVCR